MANKITLSWFNFVKFIFRLEEIGINLFLVTFIAFEFLRWTDQAGVPAYLFGFVVILLSLRIIKWILVKGDYFPTVPYDIQALLLVSAVAISLFVGIVFFQTKQNVWGGSNLRMLSGVSAVGLWFIYYIIASVKDPERLISKAFLFLMISPLLALIIFIFNLNAQIGNLLDMVLVMQAGMLWLFLTQNRLRWISLLNLIFSIVAFFFASLGAQITALSALIFSLIIVIYINRKKLPVLIVQIEKTFKDLRKNKIKLGEFLLQNIYFIYVSVAIIFFVIGMMVVLNNPLRNEIALSMQKGINEISTGLNFKTLFIGKGLRDINTTAAFTTINSFGILVIAGFLLLIINLFRNLIKEIIKANSVELKGRLIFLITVLSVVLIYLFIYKPFDQIILLFWLLIALTSLIVRKSASNKKEDDRFILRKFENSTDKNIMRIKQILQKILVLVVIGGLALTLFQLEGVIKLMA